MQVFVYGSLRRGLFNSELLGDSNFIGSCRLYESFTMHDLTAFPALVKGGEQQPFGEVYEINEYTLDRLDRLEGFPLYYNRKVVDTPYGEAWVYYMEENGIMENDSIVESGDWLDYLYQVESD